MRRHRASDPENFVGVRLATPEVSWADTGFEWTEEAHAAFVTRLESLAHPTQ